MDTYTGKRLDGRYEIHEIIGVGGMAVVYRAYDTIDDRTVAVKILKDEFLGNEEFIRRFKNESKAIAVLSHPNIVKVYDVSFGDRIQYIVEEYIDGITLREYLDQQKEVKWKEAIHFTVQILRALQHAHEKGIVHRDIKPQNIMLLQDGTIKVTDFGIARFSRSVTHTMTDRAIGSVHYIAPEQARGDLTDEKTDIYSVGVMLYEMITGQLPFEADNAVSVAIMQLQNDPRPPREINPSIPEGLEEITLRAMQKNPEQRYQSAAEMLRDIQVFRKNPGTRFQYKYFIDENPTKYIDAINMVKGSDQPVYNDDYEYVEDLDAPPKKKKKKKSVAVLITAGIAAAFLILAIGFGIAVALRSLQSQPEEVPLPDFVGMTYAEVAQQYESSSFKFTQEKGSDPTKPVDEILDQNPDAGTPVRPDEEIILTVNAGGDTVSLPDLTDYTQADAEKKLNDMNLTFKIQQVSDDQIEEGHVKSTDPPAGTQVTEGSTEITVYVSTGKTTEKVKVPNVANLSLADAKTQIMAAGLVVGNITPKDDSGKPKDTVLYTDPLNGVQLDKGDTVNLFVSSGETSQKTVTVYVPLPVEVTHDIELKAYVDGSLTDTKTVNPSFNNICTLSYSGAKGQKKNLVVTLDGSKYRTYTLNFDSGQPTPGDSYPYVPPASSSPSSQNSGFLGPITPSD
jgi:serine/threonine-protein kinase